MACSCEKGNGFNGTGGANSVYIFTDPDNGRQTTYNSAYEAKYAKRRAGNRGNIRVEPKA